MLILVQAASVCGQDPHTATSATFSPALRFVQTQFRDAREGHATLEWNRIPDALLYRVQDADEQTLYRGEFPKAFISGLADGEYRFHVTALDATGKALAVSDEAAVVVVEHWPLSQALALFGVGLTVFSILIAVIVRGAWQSAKVVSARARKPAEIAAHSTKDTSQ